MYVYIYIYRERDIHVETYKGVLDPYRCVYMYIYIYM